MDVEALISHRAHRYVDRLSVDSSNSNPARRIRGRRSVSIRGAVVSGGSVTAVLMTLGSGIQRRNQSHRVCAGRGLCCGPPEAHRQWFPPGGLAIQGCGVHLTTAVGVIQVHNWRTSRRRDAEPYIFKCTREVGVPRARVLEMLPFRRDAGVDCREGVPK